MSPFTKQIKNAEAEHKKAFIATYAVFIAVFVCMVLINIYSYFTIINMNKMATKLNSAALNVKLESTNANLLFREIYSGVSTKDMNSVWKIIEKAQGHAGLISELDPDSRIPHQIDKYKTILLKCWENKGKLDGNDAIDLAQAYNTTFARLMQEVSAVESDLDTLIKEKMAIFKKLYLALIINIVFLFFFVAFTFFRYSKQRKTAENNLASARYSMSTLLNTIDSILLSVDGEGVVAQWNTAAEKYTKISAENAIGKDILESLPFLSSYKGAITKVYHSHTPVELYRERITTDKERVFDMSMNYTQGLGQCCSPDRRCY